MAYGVPVAPVMPTTIRFGRGAMNWIFGVVVPVSVDLDIEEVMFLLW
jgi:hypothetical protein